jgi:hypothetical protein
LAATGDARSALAAPVELLDRRSDVKPTNPAASAETARIPNASLSRVMMGFLPQRRAPNHHPRAAAVRRG